MTEIAYVALGSNLGDRDAQLRAGRDGIAQLPRTRIVAESSIEETEPIGAPGQTRYLNQMIAVETGLTPAELLDALQAIERSAGRERHVRWGARTLDLDIVRFGDRSLNDARLRVPHPELANRDFWQRELAELGAPLVGAPS